MNQTYQRDKTKNNVVLIARVAGDIKAGKCVQFQVSQSAGKTPSGEWKPSMYFTIKAFTSCRGDLGDIAKGDTVSIEGRLVVENWEKDGVKKSQVCIIADSVILQKKGTPTLTPYSKNDMKDPINRLNSAPAQDDDFNW